MLLYEKETEEKNGVIVTLNLNTNYNEYNNCITAIKQQLSYLNNIWYDIKDFDNDYKIYKHELFEWNSLQTSNELHISLKGIYYPINWEKLGIPRINIGLALKFDNYDFLQPVFNREELIWNSVSKEEVKKRITEVADVLIEKYNNTLSEPVSFFKGFSSIDPYYRYLELTDRKFDISPILGYGSINVQDVKIEGVKLRPPAYYKNNLYTVLEAFEKRAEYSYRGIWKTKNIYESLDKKFKEGKKVILVDTLVGNVKEYIKENTGLSNIYVSESSKSLHWYKRNILSGIHKSQWRDYIVEFQELIKGIIAEFCEDYRGIEYKQEYLSWLEQRKERIKHDRIVNPGNYKSLNKQEGEVTISYPRNSLIGINKVFEKKVYKIEDLYKLKYVVIVFTEDEKETAQDLASLVVKEKVAIIGIREFSKIKHIQQFKTWKDFMGDNKSFKRIVTAILGERMINDYSNLTRDKSEIIQKCLVPLDENIRKIRNYNYANSKSIRSDVATAMLEVAESKNLWDEEMIPTIKNVENTLKTFDFLKYIAKPNSWEIDNVKEINTLIYQMLLFKKKYHNQLENYELVYREPVVETLLEEELELETI